MKKGVKIVLGIGALALLAMAVFKRKKPPIDLSNAMIKIPGEGVASAASLNVKVNPDNTISIGDGYVGTLVGNTIITNSRFGKPDAVLTWEIVS